jgi:hypothetical protein
MPLGQYYRGRLLHRAVAWSLVYFLRRSPVVKANPTWGKILDTYGRVLRDEQARLAGTLADGASRAERNRAAAAARAAALRAAVQGVDLAALDKAWRGYVLKLRPPRK